MPTPAAMLKVVPRMPKRPAGCSATGTISEDAVISAGRDSTADLPHASVRGSRIVGESSQSDTTSVEARETARPYAGCHAPTV
jgi:hypothetical protein